MVLVLIVNFFLDIDSKLMNINLIFLKRGRKIVLSLLNGLFALLMN